MKMIPTRTRSVLQMAQQRFPNKTATQSYLLAAVPLKNNQTNYKFDFNQKSDFPNVYLNSTDTFICDKLGFFLAAVKKSERGVEYLQTYPNVNIFPTFTPAPATLATGSPASQRNDHLYLLYNGYYKVILDNKVYFEKMDMHRHLYIPQTQTNVEPTASRESTLAGYVNLEPFIIFNGEKKHEIEVVLPSVSNMLIEAVRQTTPDTQDKDHLLVCKALGVLVSSGAR